MEKELYPSLSPEVTETEKEGQELRKVILHEIGEVVEDLIDNPKRVGSALILALLLTGKGTSPRHDHGAKKRFAEDPHIDTGPRPGEEKKESAEETFEKWQKYLNSLNR